MKMINEKTGRPPVGYSNAQWQQDFIHIKAVVQPSLSSKGRMRAVSDSHRVDSEYHGKTQYQYYCSFINDILSNIRRGKTDCCYYIYQIADLLKYEHDRLNAVWIEKDRCFKLSLNK